MLSPKRVRWRKRQKGRMRGKAYRGNTVQFGTYGLLALEPSLVIVLFSGYAHAGVDVYLSDRVRFIEKPFSVDAVAELILSALEHDR